MGSSLIELPGRWQLGKWTKPGPGWKHFEGFTKGSVSQFVVIRKSKLTQLYRLYRNIYISWNVPSFTKAIYIYYIYMYIYIQIYIYIYIFYGLYTPWNIWLTRVPGPPKSDAARAPFVEVAWDLGVQPSMTHGGKPAIHKGSPVKSQWNQMESIGKPSENRWKGHNFEKSIGILVKTDENGWKWMYPKVAEVITDVRIEIRF